MISVKKQKGRKEVMVNFPKASLVSVEPPFSKAEVYALPTEMMDEEDQYPLFDSSGRVRFYIFENKIPLSNFFWGGWGCFNNLPKLLVVPVFER